MTQSCYTLRVGERGQITLPQAVCKSLAVDAGDVLSLMQIEDVLLLSRREAGIPELSLQFSAIMQEAGVSMAELLQGMEEERRLIWEERNQ